MTRPAGAPASCLVPEDGGQVWHTLSLDIFSGKTFNISTGVPAATLILATVFGRSRNSSPRRVPAFSNGSSARPSRCR